MDCISIVPRWQFAAAGRFFYVLLICGQLILQNKCRFLNFAIDLQLSSLYNRNYFNANAETTTSYCLPGSGQQAVCAHKIVCCGRVGCCAVK